MPTLTYYAKLEEVDGGYKATVPVSTINGIEDIVGNGRTPVECGEHTKLALTTYINLQKEEGKPFPDPVYIAEALRLEIKIMNSALLVDRHEYVGQFLPTLLSEFDYEFALTDNLEDAVRHLEQRRYDAIISGSMYKLAPDDKEVDNDAWIKLHSEVQKRQPEVTFILYTGMWDINPSSYENPTVHHISKITDSNVKESFRQALPQFQ